jgi:hypothetical protein
MMLPRLRLIFSRFAPRVSPLTVLTPSKPRLVLARIVGIKIDVQARYSVISKLEDVAETTARSLAPCS